MITTSYFQEDVEIGMMMTSFLMFSAARVGVEKKLLVESQ